MDIASYIQSLDDTTAETLTLLRNYSEQQLAYKEGVRWSIMEVLEHICITEKIVCRMLTRESDTEAATAELFDPSKLKYLVVENRQNRQLSAPEMLHPKGTFTSFADFENAFTAQRNALKQQLTSGELLVTKKTYKHPYLGDMTVTDWLNFLPLHTQRHIEEIRERMTGK